MAKLYFYYSTMNAGKTTNLLQSDFNYRERGLETVCFLPEIVAKTFQSRIQSRIGLSKEPFILTRSMDIEQHISQFLKERPLACVLIDEAQFLTKAHVIQLTHVVDEHQIPVLAYGLRTDFQGELFEGSHYLLALADHLIEIKTICFCGKKAMMVARMNANGPVLEGTQVQCGGNDLYVSLCRKHHKDFCIGNLPKERFSSCS